MLLCNSYCNSNSSLRFHTPGQPLLTQQHLMTHQFHAYHIVKPSPWPLTGALSALLITSGLTIWFHFYSTTLLILGLLTTTLTLYQWWRDVVRESTYQGHHTVSVQKSLRYGIVLFIISEVVFFSGFFWAFYHSSLAPTPYLGGHWPPTGITPLNPLEVPLLNTSVLLASGVTITWAHHSLINNNGKQTIQALLITKESGHFLPPGRRSGRQAWPREIKAHFWEAHPLGPRRGPELWAASLWAWHLALPCLAGTWEATGTASEHQAWDKFSVT